MDKILIWGTGGAYAIYCRELKVLEDNKKIQILAMIDKDPLAEKLEGHIVITKEQISRYDYDLILIAAHIGGTKSILEGAQKVGIEPKKLMPCDEYLKRYGDEDTFYKEDIDIQIEVLKELLSANDNEVHDYQWMYERVCRYGIYCFLKEWRDYPEIRWSRWGMMQTAEEFTRFCCYIADLHIENAIEIGVFKGHSSYFICALLSRKNPGMKYVMIDIVDGLDSYERYKEILPPLVKRIPSTSEDFCGEIYDFVFIDGDHSYQGVMTDWNNLGKYASQVTVFHDIFAHEYDTEGGGVVRAWEEIQESSGCGNSKVFSRYPNEWMGIGCILQSADS